MVWFEIGCVLYNEICIWENWMKIVKNIVVLVIYKLLDV